MSTPYSPGLEGVTAGISAVSEVDARQESESPAALEGGALPAPTRLLYRGYDVRHLVEQCGFDEVAYLLIFGKLPNAAEYAEFRTRVGENRDVPDVAYDLLTHFPPDTHPMDALKASLAAVAVFDPDRHLHTRAANMNKAVRLYAKMPALIVNGYRILKNLPIVTPDATLDHNEEFFQLLQAGTSYAQAPPDPLFVKALNTTQILYAEHGYNASTFAARVTVSTLSDIYSGVIAAVGALKGPLHGGANEAAMEMLEEIGEPSNAAAWLRNALAQKRKIMGFGHREYKHGDVRAHILHPYAVELSRYTGNSVLSDIAQIVEAEMLSAKGLYPNVDFPVAVAYGSMGIPVPLYTPLFVMSRITGWCAHIIEQLDNNRLIRPRSEYNGPRGLIVVPIADRD